MPPSNRDLIQCFFLVHCVAFSIGGTKCSQSIGPFTFLNKMSVLTSVRDYP